MASESGELSQVGLYGLAVMGQNFALNMADKGFRVSVCNRSPEKVDVTVQRAEAEGNLPLRGFKTVPEFVASLERPRRVIILVMAGKPVDNTIAALAEHMEEGDLIVDGGNELFSNSVRRAADLESRGIMFMGMGISGGEEGARHGPSLMPGGPRAAFDLMEPILTQCSAQVQGSPCTAYLGGIGSGNYVKTVHNGIEYGDMQLLAETYDILRLAGGLTNEELAATFNEWNEGELASYLVEITGAIFGKRDDLVDDGSFLVDKILDKTGMKGTGRWTVQEFAEQSVAGGVISAALDARYLSARKDERVAAAGVLQGPPEIPAVVREQLVEDVRQALYASKIVSYAQGMSLIGAASAANEWGIAMGECARIWRGGCIIRAQFLDRVTEAFGRQPNLPNLMMDAEFASELNQRQSSWRRVVSLCIASGIPCPAFASALTYFDSYRRASLPANLTQAQRDFFGGHTYERTDREGKHHCAWTDAHKDIGDANARSAGEV